MKSKAQDAVFETAFNRASATCYQDPVEYAEAITCGGGLTVTAEEVGYIVYFCDHPVRPRSIYVHKYCQNDPGEPPQETRSESVPMQCGSIINVEIQSLGEVIPIAGTGMHLAYSSERVPGRLASYSTRVPIFPTSPTSDLSGARVKITIAGHTPVDATIMSVSANDYYDFVWNSLDSANHPVLGSEKATIEVWHDYTPPRGEPRQTKHELYLGAWHPKPLGLGGWTLSINHHYDPVRKAIEMGDGSSRRAEGQVVPGGYRVASADMSEVYIFDSNGRHASTLHGLTGTTKYTFNYNMSGQLMSVVDAFSNVTTVTYSSGVATKITAPKGQETLLGFDGDGWLDHVALPSADEYEMTYHGTAGLLATFTKPGGQTFTFTYDDLGRLTQDEGPGGVYKRFSRSRLNTTHERVRMTTSLGRVTDYDLKVGADAGYTEKRPNGSSSTHTTSGLGRAQWSLLSGPSLTTYYASDPRFGWSARRVSGTSDTTWSPAQNTSITKTVTLHTPGDVFSINILTEASTSNGKTMTYTYTGSNRRKTYTTPMGRTLKVDLSTKEQVTQSQWADLAVTAYSYSSDGRLTGWSRGTRSGVWAYDADGFVSSYENGFGQMTSYTYDDMWSAGTGASPFILKN